jgi:hypothetical protein
MYTHRTHRTHDYHSYDTSGVLALLVLNRGSKSVFRKDPVLNREQQIIIAGALALIELSRLDAFFYSKVDVLTRRDALIYEDEEAQGAFALLPNSFYVRDVIFDLGTYTLEWYRSSASSIFANPGFKVDSVRAEFAKVVSGQLEGFYSQMTLAELLMTTENGVVAASELGDNSYARLGDEYVHIRETSWFNQSEGNLDFETVELIRRSVPEILKW